MENIKLYKKNGEEFDTKDYRLIASGNRSNIYENKEGQVLKLYHDNIPTKMTIKEKTFNDIKGIDSKVIPSLGECLYNTEKRKIFPVVRAYTMDKIEKNYHTDILTMDPGKFAIEVAGRLSILSDELGKRGYILSSPKTGNIIVNNKGAFINDIDAFKRNTSISEYECMLINKKIAIKYLKMIITNCAEHRYNLGDRSNLINELLDFEILSSTDLTTKVFHNLNGKPLIKILKK